MPYVNSSMIEELEYVPETATLIVTFRSDGGIWGYLGVPPEIYAALLVAPDVDMTFNALVKDSFPRRATLAPRHEHHDMANGGRARKMRRLSRTNFPRMTKVRKGEQFLPDGTQEPFVFPE